MTMSGHRRALARIGGALALVAMSFTATASATEERAQLQAAFRPDRLGAQTTISFGFHLETSEGLAPPPMTAVALRLPAGINYSTTTLGLAICQPASLQAQGLAGCSPNSRLGYGSAFVEVPFGVGVGHELPEIQAVMGPPHNDNLTILFYANGRTPVSAQLVFTGEVVPDTAPFGSRLASDVPLISSVPGGPDVSIVRVQTTIGPSHLTYYRSRHGHRIAFHPKGVSVPEHCPRGGFPFLAEFSFQDGSRTSAATKVRCPARVPHH